MGVSLSKENAEILVAAKHVMKFAQFMRMRRAAPLPPEFNNFPGGFEEPMSAFEAKCILGLK